MNVIKANEVNVLNLGRQGEHLRTAIEFDYSDLAKEFPGGAAVLRVRMPDAEETYIEANVEYDFDKNSFVWTVTEHDTAYEGIGSCQMIYSWEGRAKSKVWKTYTGENVMHSEIAPPEWEDLIDMLSDLAAETVANADRAYHSAQDAENSAEEAAGYAEDAENQAKEAASSANFVKKAELSIIQKHAEVVTMHREVQSNKDALENATNSVTKESIHNALGFDPADEAEVSQIKDDVSSLRTRIPELFTYMAVDGKKVEYIHNPVAGLGNNIITYTSGIGCKLAPSDTAKSQAYLVRKDIQYKFLCANVGQRYQAYIVQQLPTQTTGVTPTYAIPSVGEPWTESYIELTAPYDGYLICSWVTRAEGRQIGYKSYTPEMLEKLDDHEERIGALEEISENEIGNTTFLPIVCWGDSLTYGFSDPISDDRYDGYTSSRFDHKQRIAYPEALAAMVGNPVINLGVSGETCQTIMARQGADYMLTPDFTIPASTDPVEIGTFGDLYNGGLKTKSGRSATILGYGNSGINPCWIRGVKGYLTATGQNADRSGVKYYFQREAPGTAVHVPQGTAIQTYAMKYLRGGIAIIWMGYNGQFDGPQDMVNKVNAMIAYGRYKDYLVVTCNEMYADDSYGFYKAAWGNRWLYLKPLLGRIGVQEAGLWSNGTLKENGIAQELDYDGVHFNAYGCKAIASFIFKRLLENGSLSIADTEDPDLPDVPDTPSDPDNPSQPDDDEPEVNPIAPLFNTDGTDAKLQKHYVLQSKATEQNITLGGSAYLDSGFAPYGASLADNSFTVCMKMSGVPTNDMALFTACYNKNYGDNRGVSVTWDGSSYVLTFGNNQFNAVGGGCTINTTGTNTLIMRKAGSQYSAYINGNWLYGNASIGSNVNGASFLENLSLIIGADRSGGSSSNIATGSGTVTVNDFTLYDSALSNDEVMSYYA